MTISANSSSFRSKAASMAWFPSARRANPPPSAMRSTWRSSAPPSRPCGAAGRGSPAPAAGADAMLVVAPCYNKPSQEGLFRHFAAIAEATDRQIVLYSIPGRCGIEISVGVVERLRARYANVRHIKEAGGSVDRVDQLKQAMGDDITVLSGDDSLTLPFMAVGAEGVISVASNLLVKEVSKMVRAALANDFARATKLHRKLYPISKALFIEPNPVPIKAGLKRAGIIRSDEVRAPLCDMSAASRQIVLQTFKALGY